MGRRVRDSVLGYEGGGRDVISHLVNGQDPIAYQLCLGGDKHGEHETRTITQHQSVTDVQRLEEGEGEGDEGEERMRRRVGGEVRMAGEERGGKEKGGGE